MFYVVQLGYTTSNNRSGKPSDASLAADNTTSHCRRIDRKAAV